MYAPQNQLSSGFVTTLMKDDKWYESIQNIVRALTR